jgi:hypothetical protein
MTATKSGGLRCIHTRIKLDRKAVWVVFRYEGWLDLLVKDVILFWGMKPDELSLFRWNANVNGFKWQINIAFQIVLSSLILTHLTHSYETH